MKYFVLVFYFLLTLTAISGEAYAAKAKLMLMPTRVVMDDGQKAARVELKNAGDATGQYSISMIDMTMLETGAIVDVPNGKRELYSAIPFLHTSPKSVTIAPGESQTIRIMQKRGAQLEAGEYRSHLRVRLENENVDGQSDSTPANQSAISVKAHLAIVIPVILRVGDTTYSVSIDGPKLAYDELGKPKLEMYLNRDGNRSALGDFSITYKPPTGTERLITFYPGIAVYRPTARRFVSIPLDVPSGVNLKSGNLDITYSAQEKDGGKPLAQTSLKLQ